MSVALGWKGTIEEKETKNIGCLRPMALQRTDNNPRHKDTDENSIENHVIVTKKTMVFPKKRDHIHHSKKVNKSCTKNNPLEEGMDLVPSAIME